MKHNQTSANHNTLEAEKAYAKFLEPELAKAPDFGTVRFEFIYRDGRLIRIKSNIETSVQLSPEEKGCSGAAYA